MIPIAMLLTIASLAAGPERDLSDGKALYETAAFAKAAARFEPLCVRNHNAEACYWTAISYERLGDTRTPFGCPTYRKARVYFVLADKLAPARYRGVLFDFLLEMADCSRSALREAANIVEAAPESDPESGLMRERLLDATRRTGSAEERLATFFLCVPRTTVRAAGLPGSLTGMRRAAKRATTPADPATASATVAAEAKNHQRATR